MLRFGNVTEINPQTGFARVKFLDDDIVSDWLQIVVMGAISTKFFHIFDINEQVACLMDENSEDGVILGALYNDGNPANGNKDVVKVQFPDDSFIEYNRETHEYNININGDVNIVSTGTVNVEAETAEVTAEMVSVDADTVEVMAVSVDIDADTVQIVSPSVNIQGSVIVSGSVTAASLSAPIIGGAGVTMENGNMTAEGTVTAQDVIAGTIDLRTHVHAGVQTGSGSTSPPTP